jgi:hypothetical protein
LLVSILLENKSVTCIKDKEKNDIKLVDTCNFNARNVNENIEPLLIEQPLLNTNSTEDGISKYGRLFDKLSKVQ